MHALRTPRFLLTALLIGGACVAVAANLGPDDQQVSFTGPAGSNATDAVTPAVAYADAAQRYLVVWSADQTDGEFTIEGRLLTGAGGIPVGPAFAISPEAPLGADDRQPAVAYDPVADRFLVVWSGDRLNPGAAEIMAQLVDTNGQLVGPVRRLSDMGTDDTDPAFDAVTPDVVWNAALNAFVVVWAGDDDTGGLLDGRFEIYGQLVDGTSGAETGANDFRISYAGDDTNLNDVLRPALVSAPGTSRWYVAFEGDISSDAVHDPDIWIYGGTGDVPDVSAFPIGIMGSNFNDGFTARNPDLAYAASSGELVCVWDGQNGPGEPRQIYGQRAIPDDGTMVGSLMHLSLDTSPPSGLLREATWPVIEIDPTTDEWFVAWRGAVNNGLPHYDQEVWGARFNDIGTPVAPHAVPLSAMDPTLEPVAGAGRPALAINRSLGTKLIAWSGDLFTTPGDEHEIFTQAWTDDAVTAAGDTPAAPVFALHGAAPNPFNPLTKIAFDLPRAEAVSLRVYDTAGRLVRTLLADTPAQAGRNEAVWDGRDDQGRQAASGVYLYRLVTPADRGHGRMTLVK